MDEPEWVSPRLARLIHDDQLAEHGGLPGLRDEGALDSALNRPLQLFHYGEPDLAALAGAYAFGIARNHPFTDGNKRTSLVVSFTFLALNGFEVDASDDEKIATWVALAAAELGEAAIATWFRERIQSA